MKFSLFFNFDVLPGTAEPDLLQHVEQQVILADQLGFDGVWLAEHHFHEYGKMPAPLMFLARLSGLTRHIALGTAVIEAPYYHPFRLAEDAALLDRLSGGRLRLGIGSGAGNKPGEFARFGIPIEEKGRRQIEIAQILIQAFSDGPLNFAGEFHQFHDIEIEPKPLQPFHELLAMAAGSTGTPFAADHDLALLLPRAAPDARVHELVQTYRERLVTDGPGRVVPLRFTIVAETEREAHAISREAFARYAKYDTGETWDGRTGTADYERIRQRIKFIAGTPDHVAEQVAGWIDELNASEVMGQMFAAGIRHDDAMRSMRLFAAEVMPRLRARYGTAKTAAHP